MQVVEITHFGAPDALQIAEREMPLVRSGELLIQVHASGVNRPDVLQRKGGYPPPPGASDIPGLEVAGVIIGGDPVELAQAKLAIGDRVCALVSGGGYAQFCTAPIGQCLPVPQELSLLQAAALPETYFTVWSNVFDRGQLQAGETILIHGGSSGIGVAAIQLAKAFGATVYVTAGTEEKCAACIALGADAAINYHVDDFSKRVSDMTQGRGVDVVLDMVAGPYIDRNVNCLAEDGRLVIIAVQGGPEGHFNASQVMRKRLHITGSTLRIRSVEFKSAIARALFKNVWPLLARAEIKPVLAQVFPAAHAAQAHTLMESSQHIGKIVLQWEAP